MTDWRWLASTEKLQFQAFGYVMPLTGKELADYVMMNHTAASVELAEALGELGWKPWAEPRGWVNRDAFIKELVDVGHFIANMLVAVGCTDEEWERSYRAKQELNGLRQANGYDGVTNKCHVCRRALDDEGALEQRENPRHPGVFQTVCTGCGAIQDLEVLLRNDVRCPLCARKLSDMQHLVPELRCDGSLDGCVLKQRDDAVDEQAEL